ncbi:hypothetical protein KDL29_03910 [bacterium]|nr:hypothetical protein [bacterium]
MTDREDSRNKAGRKAVPAYRQRLQQIVTAGEESESAPIAGKCIHPEGLPPEHIRRNHRPKQWRDPHLSEEIRIAPRLPTWQQLLTNFAIVAVAYTILVTLIWPDSLKGDTPFQSFDNYICFGVAILLAWFNGVIGMFTPKRKKPPRN